jgi:hypothetical protein
MGNPTGVSSPWVTLSAVISQSVPLRVSKKKDPTWPQIHYIKRQYTDRSQDAAVILLIWFGGPLYQGFQGTFICCPLFPQPLGCQWLLQRSDRFPILFSLPCGPWEYTVLLILYDVIHILSHSLLVSRL